MAFELNCSNVAVALGGMDIVKNASARFETGRLYGILGPNGAAKTTLLRALAGLIPPSGGSIELDGHALSSHPRKEIAKRISYVPQNAARPEGFTVRELAAMGRYPHQGLFVKEGPLDAQMVQEALEQTALLPLCDRRLHTLSGGEWQRALIARALCQGADGLLLDEPTANLDIAHQLSTLGLIKGLCKTKGKCAIVVLHDINHVSQYCDMVLLMDKGETRGFGPPPQILGAESLSEVYGCKVRTVTDPATSRKLFYT